MKFITPIFMAFCALFVSAQQLAAKEQDKPLLASVFTDHMVLQRGAPITVWGSAEPGERVRVSMGNRSRRTRANDDGRWSVDLPRRTAGGPYTLEVSTRSGRTQSIEDVLIGDVLLCSGQSNMEWPVSRALNPGNESRLVSNTIRHIKIPRQSHPEPVADFKEPMQWTVATPETVPHFSAVCYFTARELQKHHNVPMGLVNSSWGGSQIEAWISGGGLRTLDRFETQLNLLDLYARDPKAALTEYSSTWEDWWGSQNPEKPSPWDVSGNDLKDWTPVPGPMRDWKNWDLPDLTNHNGMVWFARSVTLTPEQAAQGATLNLAAMDELDMTWVNGQFINGTFGWGTWRSYDIPAGALKAGENIIVVNVLNTWGAGGMTGPEDSMNLTLTDGSIVPLGGVWRFQKVPASYGSPPRTPWESVGGLTTIYNAMIAPLKGMQLKGAVWYQGESNAGRAGQYQALLEALFADWRGLLGKDLPMIVVQLPGFGAQPTNPVNSGWGRLREAQRQAVLATPGTGLTVTIDAGDRWDIHPPNKQVVGARVARTARSVFYGEDIEATGPAPTRATGAGSGEVTIHFKNATGALETVSSNRPIAFELCNADGAECHFVDARLDGNAIRLRPSDGAPHALIRYCWGDAPICNLYDGYGLPVGPFEIEVSQQE